MRYHPFRHLGLKALAVAIASLLWVTVAGEHVVERSIRVPLEFRNIPRHLDIVGTPPDNVDVRLRGSSAVLNRLQPGEIVAVLDLANARQGPRLFHIRTDEVRAPFGVGVAQVMPATLPIELEPSARRTVPIVPATQGDPAPGFVTGKIVSDPPTVEIVGPEPRVRQISDATTEPVSVAGATATVTDTATVGVVDSSVRLAQPLTVKVSVDVHPAPVERSIGEVPVRSRNLAPGLRAQISPQFVQVTVRGTSAAVRGLENSSVQAYVDLAGLGAGRYNLQVQMDPSQSFGVKTIDPATVTITVK